MIKYVRLDEAPCLIQVRAHDQFSLGTQGGFEYRHHHEVNLGISGRVAVLEEADSLVSSADFHSLSIKCWVSVVESADGMHHLKPWDAIYSSWDPRERVYSRSRHSLGYRKPNWHCRQCLFWWIGTNSFWKTGDRSEARYASWDGYRATSVVGS